MTAEEMREEQQYFTDKCRCCQGQLPKYPIKAAMIALYYHPRYKGIEPLFCSYGCRGEFESNLWAGMKWERQQRAKATA